MWIGRKFEVRAHSLGGDKGWVELNVVGWGEREGEGEEEEGGAHCTVEGGRWFRMKDKKDGSAMERGEEEGEGEEEEQEGEGEVEVISRIARGGRKEVLIGGLTMHPKRDMVIQ